MTTLATCYYQANQVNRAHHVLKHSGQATGLTSLLFEEKAPTEAMRKLREEELSVDAMMLLPCVHQTSLVPLLIRLAVSVLLRYGAELPPCTYNFKTVKLATAHKAAFPSSGNHDIVLESLCGRSIVLQ